MTKIQVTSRFYSKFPSTCAYAGCFKGNVIQRGEFIRIVGERRPRNENTKRPVYHDECWQLSQTGNTSVHIIQPLEPQDIEDMESTDFTPASILETVVSKSQDIQENTMAGNDLATLIAQAVQPLLKANAEIDESKVIALIKQYSTPQPTLVHVQTDQDNEPKDLGLQHHTMPLLLSVMSARQASGFRLNIWLTGPAGSGKTTAASNCADALELKFYFTGALDNPYGLLGFVDAHGKVVRTQFREAYENGGVFLFDEIDGSTPSAVLPFNTALANGHCAFPDAIVDRHKDFVCIAAANTWGLGATNDYVGRMKLDAASLDRFVQIAWDVDEMLETATCGNAQWAARVQVIRARVRDKGIKVVVSPRASYYGAALLAGGMVQHEVERLTLRKAMTDDQWNSVSGKTKTANATNEDDIPF